MVQAQVKIKSYEQELLEIVWQLDEKQRQQLLDIARGFSRPPTISGKEFVEQTKDIRISDEDAQQMMTAIRETFDVIEEIEVDFDE